MDKYVTYNKGQIDVALPEEKDLVVYTHPHDKVYLDFDISNLKTTIINGDLVIESLSGHKVTIANYALMSMSNEAPQIADMLGNKYTYNNFLSDIKITYSADNPDSYVVDRKISSPENSDSKGDLLNSAKSNLNKNEDELRLLGDIEVEEQNPVFSTEVVLSLYPIRTLSNPTEYRYDVPIVYSYSGKTMLQEEEDDNLPIQVLELKVQIEPLYGTETNVVEETISANNSVVLINPIFGGGDLVGNDYATYQYDPEVLDFSTETNDIIYYAYSGDKVVRGLSIGLPTNDTYITEIRIDDMPAGVTLISSDQSKVQPIGNGSYIITPESTSSFVEVYMEYPLYMDDVSQSISITVSGYNTKLDSVVHAEANVTLEFHDVNSGNDISNFTQFNTFSFSTGIDPLIVNLGSGNDIVYGDQASHTYNTGAGNDQVYSGTGNETVNLQEGDDIFYVGLGDDVVTAAEGYDTIKFAHDAIDINLTTVTLGDGAVNFNIIDKDGNAGGLVKVSGFEQIDFEDDQYLESLNQENVIFIDSTAGLDGFIISMGKANDSIYINHSATVVAKDFAIYTADTTDCVYYNDGVSVVEKIYGSEEDDTLIATDFVGIDFDAQGGKDTADYTNLTSTGIVYKSAESTVSKSGREKDEDIVKNFEVFYGTAYDDIFYASLVGSSEYYGYDQMSYDHDVVSYEEEGEAGKEGVIIDYTNSTKIVVTKADGVDTLTDIEEVIASKGDDTFIVGTNTNNLFDGLDGFDTLDYSDAGSPVNIVVSNSSTAGAGAQGSVQKSSFNDNYSNIEAFVGTKYGDSVVVQDPTGALSYDGGEGNDSIDYSQFSYSEDVYIVYDFSRGNVQKYDANGLLSEDEITSFEIITATENNDTFILHNEEDLNKLYQVDAAGNKQVDKDDRDSTGDVLVLDFASDDNDPIDLSKFTLVFENFESVELGDYNNTISIDLINNTYIHIYGGAGKDTFNASNAVEPLIFEVSSSEIIVSNINSEITRLYDFEVINGSFQNDTFKVNSDADSSWEFDGSTGYNILDYSETENIALTINIADGTVDKFDTDGKTKGQDEFTNMNKIIGGQQNDTFLVDENSNTTIDGGGGDRNVVSFENSQASLELTDQALVGQYINIQAFILTNNADTITFISTDINENVPIDVEGGAGIDTVNISDEIGNVTYTINEEQVTLDIGLVKGEEQLKNFEILNGSKKDDTFKIMTMDNSAISSDGTLSFNGGEGQDSADFSNISVGLDVRVGINGLNYEDPSLSYISVQEAGGSNSIDYLHEIESVVLTANDDTIYLNLLAYATTNIADVSIDAGEGADTLDFSENSIPISFDIGANTVTYGAGVVADISNITNWEKVIGTTSNDTFIIDEDNSGIAIDGNTGWDKVDYSSVNASITINLVNDTIIIGDVDNEPADFKNIEEYKLSQQDDTIIGDTNNNIKVDGGDGNDTLDYSSANTDSLEYGGYIFNIDGDSVLIIKDQLNSNYDTVENVEVFIGTDKDDVFNINSLSSNGLTINGGDGRDTLYINDDLLADTGLIFDLSQGTLSTTDGTLILNMKNIEVLEGSAYDDLFIIADENFFTEHGDIRAGEGEDILDLTGFNSNTGIYVSLEENKLYLYKDGGQIDTAYISVAGIEKIQLGDADDAIIYSSGGINTDITEVDGGGGNNYLSFEKLRYAIDKDITEVGGSGDSSITYINFNDYKFTSYNDNITISDSSSNKAYHLDGYDGLDDTLDYSNYSTSVALSIDDTGVEITRGNQTDEIINFEHFILTGNNDSVIIKTAGVYNIDGGGGTDSLTYELGDNNYLTVDFNTHIIYIFDGYELMGYNQFSNFEEFTLTKNDDIVYIADDSGDFSINGNGGNDIINFSNSSNSITYNESNEITVKVSNSDGSDYEAKYTLDDSFKQVIGSDGDDTFILTGTQSDMFYFGGAGIDTLSFAGVSDGGVVVNIGAGTFTVNDKTNTFNSMEVFVGSSGDDSFTGLTNYNSYTIDGGAGTDNVSYDSCLREIEVTIDKNANVTIDKGGITDNLTSIESYTGTHYNDTFTLDVKALANVDLDGNTGFDTLVLEGEIAEVSFMDGELTIDNQTAKIENFESIELTDADETLDLDLQKNNTTAFNMAGGSNIVNVTSTGLGTLSMNYAVGSNQLAFITNESNNIITGNLSTVTVESDNDMMLRVTDIDFNSTSNTNIELTSTALSTVYFSDYSNLSSVDVNSNESTNQIYFNQEYNNPAITIIGADVYFFHNAETVEVNVQLGEAMEYDLVFSGAINLNVDTLDPASPTVAADNTNTVVYEGSALKFSSNATDCISITTQDITNSTLTYNSTNDLIIDINSSYSIEMLSSITVTDANVTVDLSDYNSYLGEINIAKDSDASYVVSIDFNIYSTTDIYYNHNMTFILTNKNDEININDLTALESTYISGGQGNDTLTISADLPDNNITIDNTGWDERITDFEVLKFTTDVSGNVVGHGVQVDLGGDDNVNNWNTIILPELLDTDALDDLADSNQMENSMSLSTLDFSNATGVDLLISFDFNQIEADATRLEDRLFNLDGTYDSNSNANDLHAENIRAIKGSSSNDIFTFTSLTYEQVSQITYYLSNGNATYSSSDDTSLDIDGGKGEDIVYLSALGASDHAEISEGKADYFSYKMVINDDSVSFSVNASNSSYAFSNMDKGYQFFQFENIETFYLPTADIAIQESSSTQNITLIAAKTSNPENIVAINNSSGAITYTNVLDGKDGVTTGISSTTEDSAVIRTYQNIPVIMFSATTSDTIVIAKNGELYTSSMVELRMDGAHETAGYKPDTNGDYPDNSKTNADSVDFSSVDDGLTFSYGMWDTTTQELYSEDNYIAPNPDGSDNFTGQVSDDYKTKSKSLGGDNSVEGGIIVTDDTDYLHLTDTDGYDQDIYYRILDVETIIATSGDDTWVWGQVLFMTTEDQIFNIERQTQTEKSTILQIIDGADGYDTIYMIGWNPSVASNGEENPHCERTITYEYGVKDDWSKTSLKIMQKTDGGTPDGTPDHGGHYGYDQIINNLQYDNFEAYIADDYGYMECDMMLGNYYRGADDDLNINIKDEEVFKSGPDVIEFDLGGRYFTDVTDPTTMETQDVIIDLTAIGASDLPVRMSWLSEPSQDTWGDEQHGGVDSYLSIDLGASYQYSTIILKNFDTLTIKGVGQNNPNDNNKISMSINTNLNFNALDGKTFTFTIEQKNADTGSSTNVFLYSNYNYYWDVSDEHKLILFENDDGNNTLDSNEMSFTLNFTMGYTTTLQTSYDAGYYVDADGNYLAPEGYEYYTDAEGSIHLVDDNSSYLGYQAPEDVLPEVPMADNSDNINSMEDNDKIDNSVNHNLDDILANGKDIISNFIENHDLNDIHNNNVIVEKADILEDMLTFVQNHTNSNLESESNSQNNFMDNFINQDNNIDKEGDKTQVDMDSLIAKLPSLVDNIQESDDSLISTIQNINNLSEDMINQTQQEDEANSLSFALDDMFSLTGDDHNVSLNTESHSKAKNHS